jgi:MFS family permease
MIGRFLLPRGAHPSALPLLLARALRAFADGYIAVLLPAYLLALGFGAWEVGVLATATLLGSACATMAVGAWGHRVNHHSLILGAAALMAATGFAFGLASTFWPLLMIAFAGTLNPSSGDVSVFLPLEHARLAESADGDARTSLFARYSLLGSLSAALGALAAALPSRISTATGLSAVDGLRCMFALYGLVGCGVWMLYRSLPTSDDAAPKPRTRLEQSRPTVIRLAALFSVDSFAGGLVVNALLALWLFKRFDMSVASAGQFFFWSGLSAAASQLAAPPLARRIGLVNTMVFTHIPASLCLIGAAFAPSIGLALGLLIVRALMSSMDVPARSAFVMSVVTPAERAAAASFTAVPRSLASAAGPVIGAGLFAGGFLAAPLVVCGALKIAYDLAIWRSFKDMKQSP